MVARLTKHVLHLILVIVLNTTRCQSSNFELTILHTNDIEGRYNQFKQEGKTCFKGMKCFGGLGKRFHVVNRVRNQTENVILVDAGNHLKDDKFGRNFWVETFKGRSTATLMNMIEYDAMVLGHNEYLYGNKVVENFLQTTKFPVLSCNLREYLSELGKSHIKCSTVVEKNGRKIGIIGYQWSLTMSLKDVRSKIEAEIKILKSNGTNIIILLAGDHYENYKKLATMQDLDVIIGSGRIFQFNGENHLETMASYAYPIVINQTLLVTTLQYGKYLGNLKITFDANGDIISYSGNPIVLDEHVKSESKVESIVERFNEEVMQNANKEYLGWVRAPLSAKDCCIKECNFGNMITDAFVNALSHKYDPDFFYMDDNVWAHHVLGIWNCGNINTSTHFKKEDSISLADILNALPHGDQVAVVRFISGKDIRLLFEHSVSNYGRNNTNFLQVSGFRVRYNLQNDIGKRVVELRAMCIKCDDVPMYEDVADGKNYTVLMPESLMHHKHGLDMLKTSKNTDHFSHVVEYVAEHVTKYHVFSVEDRIRFVENIGMLSSSSVITSEFYMVFTIMNVLICFSST